MSLLAGAGFKPVVGGAPAVLLRACACVAHFLAFARKQGGTGKSEAAGPI